MSEAAVSPMPPRPAIPLTLYGLLLTLALERAVLGCSFKGHWLLLGSLGLLVALIASALLGSRHGGQFGLLAILAGCLLATGLCIIRLDSASEVLGSNAVSSFEFELAGDPSPNESGWRCRAHALEEGVVVGDVWLSASERYDVGDVISCIGRYSACGDDEWGRSSRMQGVVGGVKLVRLVRRSSAGGSRGVLLGVRRCVLESLDATASDSRAFLAAICCGDASAMRSSGLSEAFSACGLAHLAAVSGTHIALVATLFEGLLEHLRAKPAVRSALVLFGTAVFVAFCGAPASALRAWGMSCAAILATSLGRRGDSLSAVSLVSLLMALVDPTLSGQVGFFLSVASVIGLCLFGPYTRRAVRDVLPIRPPRGLPRGLSRGYLKAWTASCEALAMTLVCQMATFPISASTFGEVSLLAPVSAVVLSPALGLLLPLGLLCSALFWCPGLQRVVLLPCDLLGGAFSSIVRWAAKLPFSQLSVVVNLDAALVLLLLFACVLYALWPRLRRRTVWLGLGALAICMTLWLGYWRFFAPARVCVLDVGQGDSILIIDGAASLLVDTGPDDSVAQALARQHVTHVDTVLLTHLHDDHAGGLDELLGHVSVGEVVVGQGALEAMSESLKEDVLALTGKGASEVSHGDVVRVGNFSLKIISPTAPATGDENDDSLELLLGYEHDDRQLTALLTGDAERGATLAAIDRGEVGDVDLLKVGHHGSAISLDRECLEALRPEVSVISAGKDNNYGHPTDACLALLEDAGSAIYCTIDCSDVTVYPGDTGPVVSTRNDTASDDKGFGLVSK